LKKLAFSQERKPARGSANIVLSRLGLYSF